MLKYSPDKQTMTVAEEHRHSLRAFIQTYRDLPILWDTSLRDYTNRDKRADAYRQLVPIYRYLKRDATVEDVKKKINTLRTNYRKELKVVENARQVGTCHTPRCWTFHELDFLRNAEKFLAVNSSLTGTNAFSYNENTQTQMSFVEQTNSNTNNNNDNNGATGQSSFKTINCAAAAGGGTTAAHSSITDMFLKSFGHKPFEERIIADRQTAESSDILTPLVQLGAEHIEPQPQKQTEDVKHFPPAKKLRQMSIDSHTTRPTAIAAAHTAHNSNELLNIACDYLATQFPEEESIARTWTYKLKRMQREQRLLAEKFINEILFEAESGTLHRGSVQINAYEPYVRYEEAAAGADHSKSQSPSVNTSSEIKSDDSGHYSGNYS